MWQLECKDIYILYQSYIGDLKLYIETYRKVALI